MTYDTPLRRSLEEVRLLLWATPGQLLQDKTPADRDDLNKLSEYVFVSNRLDFRMTD